MNNPKTSPLVAHGRSLRWIIAAAIAAVAIGVFLWHLPVLWIHCLQVLDVRYWPAWKRIVVVVVVAETLLVIRFWPERAR